MQITLCNEVLQPMTLSEQCAFASAVGYDGLEIAPFTLAEDPSRLTADEVAGMRRTVEGHGLSIPSVHYFTMAPKGINLTSLDPEVRDFTRQALLRLVDVAAGLGAGVIVQGSPPQRRLGNEPERQRAVAMEHFAAAGERAGRHGIAYCLEAITSRECNFLNTIAQAEAMIAEIGEPALKLMIDVSHASQEESEPLPALGARLAGEGRLTHVQLNAINRRGPGESDDPAARDAIAPFLQALLQAGYEGSLAMEPFIYEPDGRATAARAVGYVRGVLAGLGASSPEKN